MILALDDGKTMTPIPSMNAGAAEGHESRMPAANTTRAPRQYQVDGKFGGSFGRISSPHRSAHWWFEKDYFVKGWTDPSIWRATMLELLATALLTYISGQFGLSLIQGQAKFVMGYVGFFNSALLAIFIYASIPGSGGHLNPLITFSTFLCGLCPAPRAFLYISAQTLGGALAGGMLIASWGRERAEEFMGGGCFFDPEFISPNQVLANEIFCSLALIYLAMGVGLDPRQQLLFGPQLGPALVGFVLGLITAGTSGIAPGYTGPNMMPSRALGLSIARGNYSYLWIYWVGPAIAGIIIAIVYSFAPPYHADRPKSIEPTSLA